MASSDTTLNVQNTWQGRHIASIALLVIGIAFLLFAIFGRYLVIPGYLESLESGSAAGGAIPADVVPWKVARYILWGYSFKLGILLVAIGALIKTSISRKRLALLSLGGLVYLVFAFALIPAPPLLFGIGGMLMTLFIVLLLLQLAAERERPEVTTASAVDLRIVGCFFFAMATYTLCALVGTKGFVLEPEKMIQYGLQAEAASYAAHVLIELVLAWFFVWLSFSTFRFARGAEPIT